MSFVDDSKETILAALRDYHGGNIYLMGSRAVVADGFEMHNANEVQSIEWGKNCSCLHVRIGTAGRVVVNVRIKEEKLALSCTCSRGSTGPGCEHTVCAVLTLKNLLMPEVFKPREPKRTYRKGLLAGLVGTLPEKLKTAARAEYSVVLELNKSGDPDVYVALDGERVTKFADLLGTPLREFAVTDSSFPAKIDTLIRLLKRSGDKYPTIIRDGGENRKAVFDPELSLETFTELELREKDVIVAKGLRDEQKQSILFFLFGDLAYLPATDALMIIQNTQGWETWKKLGRDMTEAGHCDAGIGDGAQFFSIPLDIFASVKCTVTQKEIRNVRFTLNSRKARPVRADFGHRLTIMLPEDGTDAAVLRAECVYGDFSGTINYDRFRFFEHINRMLPQYFDVGKRKEALVRAFFALMPKMTDARAEEIIKVSLDEGEITKPDMRSEARRLLLLGNMNVQRGDAAQMIVQDGKWLELRHDTEREALLFKIPYEVFGWEIFDNMQEANAMRIPAGLLFERLPLLYERLSDRNIALYMKGKPIKQSRYEFTIDASQKNGTDWFELRSEIRCEGKMLDGVSLDKLFGATGVVEQDDCVQILDSNTHRVLTRIAAAWRMSKGKGKKEREVVRIPRLQILDWAALRTNGVTVRLSPDDDEIVARLMQFERIEEKPLPKKLKATLRPYQHQGYSWLAFLYEHRLGACLADDMGLGKTLQAIAFLGGIAEGVVTPQKGAEKLQHLIVLPPSLVFNWEHEINRFYPGFKLHIYIGAERNAAFDGADVVLTTYGTARQDIEKLKDLQFHTIIFDEAQAVKNLMADTTGAVRQLKGLFNLTMTGTPVENHLGEYYSVVDLAVPGLLGEYDQFRPLVKSGVSADLDLIIKRTRPFVLRRTKEAVLTDLPPKTETDVYLDLTEQQKALYQKTVEQVRSTIDDAYKTKVQSQARIIALTAILKLRQICITPQLVDPELAGVSPKMDFLIDQVQELMEENHSALVFSQFTSFLDILGDALKERGIGYLRLDGSTPTPKRKELVKEFMSGEGPSVFLLSLKAGGQGLNLTRASYVFHLDPWWNPAVENQASDRAHRMGQKNKVTITRLLMRHTIEEKIMELKEKKKELYSAILDSGEMKGNEAITRGDFDFLLGA